MKKKEEITKNKLGTMPVRQLMLSMGIPMILSMMLQAVYNIVDSTFVSKSIGQGDYKKANKVAGNALFLACVIYILFLLFGLFGVNAYASTQTTNPQIKEMVITYLRICCVASPGIVFFSIFEKLLQAMGHSVYSTITQVIGAI